MLGTEIKRKKKNLIKNFGQERVQSTLTDIFRILKAEHTAHQRSWENEKEEASVSKITSKDTLRI
jgi:hypothetical protein